MMGWYIWSGNTPGGNGSPLCAHHMNDKCPEIVKYLALAPRWRFLVAPPHCSSRFSSARASVASTKSFGQVLTAVLSDSIAAGRSARMSCQAPM